MPRCLIALGANLGDRQHTLAQAVAQLSAQPHISLVAQSRWHQTAPIGGAPGQDSFLNGVLALDTNLSPHEICTVLGRIEERLGRTRGQRWAARLIDLDLLLYDDRVITTPSLVVPHPRMAWRRFVLAPAAEIAPDMIHPTIGWSMRQLLAHLNTAVPYIALLAPPGRGKTALAEALARHAGGRVIADSSNAAALPDSPNPPSHAYERQIQFLDRRSRLLDLRDWPRSNELAVSDFYFDQSLAYAQMELAARDQEAFGRASETAKARVVSPKLLVVLEEAPGNPDAPPDPSAAGTEHGTRLRSNLLALAARRGIGPVLYAGVDRSAQFDEVAAAIAAMR
jgi:2-amino-4-hydroxy-6-hydroxymethyldihydropteridine diphosphokinase